MIPVLFAIVYVNLIRIGNYGDIFHMHISPTQPCTPDHRPVCFNLAMCFVKEHGALAVS